MLKSNWRKGYKKGTGVELIGFVDQRKLAKKVKGMKKVERTFRRKATFDYFITELFGNIIF